MIRRTSNLPTIKPLGSQLYFYGRITRDEAEIILRERGCQDGLFLLRESTKRLGDFVLSLCFHNNIHHYSLETQDDGQVMIENGKKFPGPVELLDYHKHHKDGLLTFPTLECSRPPNKSFTVFRGISANDLEDKLEAKAKQLKIQYTREDLLNPGEIRNRLLNEIKPSLHQEQGWYHDDVSREEAERRFQRSGHEDGKFLLRMQRGKGEYRLSLSFKGEAKHYIVSYKNSKYFIENGPTFDSLIEMVDHYHNKADGLLCPLRVPCIRPYRGAEAGMTNGRHELSQPKVHGPHTLFSHVLKDKRLLPPSPHQNHQLSYSLANDFWDEPDQLNPLPPPPVPHFRNVPAPPPARVRVDDETQKIYDSVPTNEASFNLSTNDLELFDKLGAGCFGSVLRGVYRQGGREIPVAVKTLKLDDEQSKEEIMTEAHLMAALKHRHIVRLIGVCHGEQIMLVLELAPMGPLNKFLKERVTFKMESILNLMYQVALGMRYLESQRFVHRDLAARNVLMVNESFAKISDFGMSKALGMDGEYYKASKAGKWPLKWYAPECIYYFKFDSKSDVWSYGVTLWEATSRGGKPYQKLKGADIVKMIDEGERLEKPSECPPEVYSIMQHCWQYEKEARPRFEELAQMMKRFSLNT